MFDALDGLIGENITMADDDRIGLKIHTGLEEMTIGRRCAEGLDAQWCCKFGNIPITECADVPVVANHSIQQLEVGEKFQVAVSANHLIACVDNSHGIL
jgi:hypothetical protein